MINAKGFVYICTNCGKRGNTLDIKVFSVTNDDEVRQKQLENMEQKVREHNWNVKDSIIPFLKIKRWDVQPIYDEVLGKDFWMVCEDNGLNRNGLNRNGYNMWKPVTKDKVSADSRFLYINCPKCNERVYLGSN